MLFLTCLYLFCFHNFSIFMDSFSSGMFLGPLFTQMKICIIDLCMVAFLFEKRGKYGILQVPTPLAPSRTSTMQNHRQI